MERARVDLEREIIMKQINQINQPDLDQQYPTQPRPVGSPEPTDWRLVYTLLIAFLAASAAFYSVIAPIYWAFDSKSPLAAYILLQDSLITAMTLALAFTAIRFTWLYPLLGFLSCTGAVLCAATLVRGG